MHPNSTTSSRLTPAAAVLLLCLAASALVQSAKPDQAGPAKAAPVASPMAPVPAASAAPVAGAAAKQQAESQLVAKQAAPATAVSAPAPAPSDLKPASANATGGAQAAPAGAPSGLHPSVSLDSLLASEEYVQIRPEEINVHENGKDIEPNLTLMPFGGQQGAQAVPRGYLSESQLKADEQLSAHLASADPIGPQESVMRPYPQMSAPSQHPPRRPKSHPRPNKMRYNRAQAHAGAQQGYRGPKEPMQHPMQQQLGRPQATVYHHQYQPGKAAVAHLPRGAAAGYAAFKDFVRARAHKYRPAGNPVPVGPSISGGQYGQPQPQAAPLAPLPAPVGYPQKAQKLQRPHKLAVAQAYIPQPSQQQPQQQPYGAGAPVAGSAGGYGAPMNHAAIASALLSKPLEGGKPEYSKEYGMVIQYPQATVYTEPMTVDQVNKLTGNGISHILEQVQHKLAHGQRDESSTLAANQAHQLGHGLAIHNKEYYAPNQHGKLVATTAAVIASSAGAYGAPTEAQQGYGQSGEHKQEAQASHGGYSSTELAAISNMIGAELKTIYRQQAAPTRGARNQPHRIPNPQANHKGRPRHAGKHGQQYKQQRGAPRAPQAYQQPQPHPQPQQPPSAAQMAAPVYEEPQRPASQSYGHSLRINHQVQQAGYSSHQQHQQASNYGKGAQQQQMQPAGQYQNHESAMEKQMVQLLKDLKLGDEQYDKNRPVAAMSQGYPHKLLQKYQKIQQLHQQPPQGAYAAPQQYGAAPDTSAYAQHEGVEIPQGPNDQIGEIADLVETLKGAFEAQAPPEPHLPAGYSSPAAQVQAPAQAQQGYQRPQPQQVAPLQQSYQAAVQHIQFQPQQQQQQASYGPLEAQSQPNYGPSNTASKAADVHYLAAALAQPPSYVMQVPVSEGQQQQHPAAEQHQVQQQPIQEYQQQQQQQPQLQIQHQVQIQHAQPQVAQQAQYQLAEAQPLEQPHPNQIQYAPVQAVAAPITQQPHQQQTEASPFQWPVQHAQPQPQPQPQSQLHQQQQAKSYLDIENQYAQAAQAAIAPSDFGLYETQQNQDDSLRIQPHQSAHGYQSASAQPSQGQLLEFSTPAAAPVAQVAAQQPQVALASTGSGPAASDEYAAQVQQQYQQQSQTQAQPQHHQQAQQQQYQEPQQVLQIQQAHQYQQQQQQPQQQHQQQQQQPLEASQYQTAPELHSIQQQPQATIINHLVPVASPATATKQASSYESSSQQADSHSSAQTGSQQLASDGQYQNVQSLSSFVNSLPAEYQDLLRQTPHSGASSPGSNYQAAEDTVMAQVKGSQQQQQQQQQQNHQQQQTSSQASTGHQQQQQQAYGKSS